MGNGSYPGILSGLVERLAREESSPRLRYLFRKLQLALDLGVLVGSFALANLLRFDFRIPDDQLRFAVIQLPYLLLVQLAALHVIGVYSFVWRYVGLSEVEAFLKAACLSAMPTLLLRLFLPEDYQAWRVPVSVIVLDTGIAFGGVLGVRVLRRAVYERYEKHSKAPTGRPHNVLLVGAGRAGVMAVREMESRSDLNLVVLGFVDKDPEKRGAVIAGVRVLGHPADLPRLVKEHRIDLVVITLAQASRHAIRELVETCERIPVKVKIIPALSEILEGRVEISRIRDVEIEDLLGREPVRLDEVGLKQFLRGKHVMVTGAGGSIGSELARQVARFEPARLDLVERAEFALFEIHRELAHLRPELRLVPLVADVGDEAAMRAILSRRAPHVIFHAAAHKHVPMMELCPAEAIKNNVLATRLLGELAGTHGVAAFVLISTDKAVRPSSIMGASKRVAELVVQDLARKFPTRYVAVRFGNVMGSTGSVIPIFREQIARGGPVTVTHAEMTRYFMTIPEAAQLVLQAGAMGRAGEILILDMGDPVSILNLARDMIRLSGLKPLDDIEIVFTGLRPGEKLTEELGVSSEHLEKTEHEKILVGKLAIPAPGEMDRVLSRLAELSRDGSEDALRTLLQEVVPEALLEPSTAPARK